MFINIYVSVPNQQCFHYQFAAFLHIHRQSVRMMKTTEQTLIKSIIVDFVMKHCNWKYYLRDRFKKKEKNIQ